MGRTGPSREKGIYQSDHSAECAYGAELAAGWNRSLGTGYRRFQGTPRQPRERRHPVPSHRLLERRRSQKLRPRRHQALSEPRAEGDLDPLNPGAGQRSHKHAPTLPLDRRTLTSQFSTLLPDRTHWRPNFPAPPLPFLRAASSRKAENRHRCVLAMPDTAQSNPEATREMSYRTATSVRPRLEIRQS